jgi:redox-sensitive bicupin YhaK (pirin superfamily)
MIFLYEGTCLVGETRQSVKKDSAVVFDTDEKEDLEIVGGDDGCKFLLLAGLALNEPIKQYGPFVLSTQSDLEQAFEDYHGGQNGFEGAHEWKSEIRKMSKRR